jgi:hypothetical protein
MTGKTGAVLLNSHSRFNGATHDFNLISANLTLYM